MNMNAKAGVLAVAVTTLAMAVPAAAHPGNSSHAGKSNHDATVSAHAQSHSCKTHNVAYVESGTVDSATPSTLAVNPDGTWSGTLMVDVTRTNHWANADHGQTLSYTLSDAKLRVRLDGGASGFTAGARVTLIGKLATVAKKCTASGSPTSPVFRTIVVYPAATA